MDFSRELREAIDRSVLCWLSTSSADGQPSVSPKEVFVAGDDGCVLIANIASPGSARNVKANPRACVAVLDVFRQKGFQLFGAAEVIAKADASFDELSRGLRAIAGETFPFSSLFRIRVEEIKPIIAPRYRLYPDTTEQDQIDDAMRSYGVRPRDSSLNH